MNKPTADTDFEAAVETALDGLKIEPEVYESEPLNMRGNMQAHATLIEKSRALFAKQIESLDVRIRDVNERINVSIDTRNKDVAIAEKLHQERMREIERDMYQIKTLKAAVELAVAALGYE